MTTTEDNVTFVDAHGAAPPVFSGRMADWENFEFDVDMWVHGTKLTKTVQGSRLYGAQTNARVKAVMKTVGAGVMKSEKGVEEIMKALS